MAHDGKLYGGFEYMCISKSIIAHLVQTRLTIEQNDVPIDNMPFYNVANPQAVRNGSTIAELQVFLESAAARRDVVRTRVNVATVAYSLLK